MAVSCVPEFKKQIGPQPRQCLFAEACDLLIRVVCAITLVSRSWACAAPSVGVSMPLQISPNVMRNWPRLWTVRRVTSASAKRLMNWSEAMTSGTPSSRRDEWHALQFKGALNSRQ